MNEEMLKLFQNEQTITYYPIYKNLMNSISGAMLLSYLINLFFKKEEFSKTDEEIMQEIGIGVGELKSAKKNLKTLGFLEINLKGLPATTHYKIDWKIYKRIIIRHKFNTGKKYV